MRTRRIYHILCLLKEEEAKDFREFLVSPLFGGSKMLQRFFDLWEERILGQEGVDLEPEAFLEGSGFQVSRLDKLCSQLLRKSLEFISLKEYQQSETLQYSQTSKGLINRGAPEDEIRRQEDRFQKWLGKQNDSAEKQMEVLHLAWRAAEAKTRSRQTKELYKEGFRDLHEKLDNYYFLQKLKLASATANARLMYKQAEDPASAFISFFREHAALEELSPLIQCYFHNIEMLAQSDALKHFQQLTGLLQENASNFDLGDAAELYNYALNFTIRKGNQGELVYRTYTGALYRDLLEKGLLFVGGKLPSPVFKNLVVSHCRLGKLDWVANFIAEYRDKLPDGTHPSIITYNEGVLAFFKADYGSAIKDLKEVVSQLKNDVFYELDARTYLWKSYFEHFNELTLDEVDEMDRMYDAFRIFIDRNKKVSEIHKLQYRNFIREFKRLQVLQQQAPLNLENLKDFEQDIQSMEYTYNKDWFLLKVREMIDRV